MNFLWKTLIAAAGVAGTAGAGVWAYKWITKDKSANDEPNKPPEKAADSGKTQDQQPVHELATVAVRNDKKDAQVQVRTENTGVVDEENKKLKEEVQHLKSVLSAKVAQVEQLYANVCNSSSNHAICNQRLDPSSLNESAR